MLSDGVWKLTDFGESRMIACGLKSLATRLTSRGTPFYAAP